MNETHTAHAVPVGKSNERTATSADEPFLTGAELEAAFKISASHRLHLDKCGMPHLSLGKSRRYLRSQVEEFLRSRAAEQETSTE